MRLKCEYCLVSSGVVLMVVLKCPFDLTRRLFISGIVLLLFGMLYCMERLWKRSNTSCNGQKMEPTWKNFKESQRTQFFGLWCTCVIPLIVLVSRGLSEDFWTLIVIQIPIFGFMLSATFALKTSSSYSFAILPTICTIMSMVAVLRFMQFNWFFAVTFSTLLFYASIVIPARLVIYFSKCFTFGEFIVIWQALLFCLHKSLITFHAELTHKSSIDEAQSFISLTFIFLLTLIVVSFYCKKFWLNLFILISIFIITSYGIMQRDYLSYLFALIFNAGKPRLIILNFWALCLACTLHFAIIVSKSTKLTTVHRKFFHLTVSFVLISGLLYDPQFMYLASIFALYGFIIVELIRYFNVPPFGESLRSSLEIFLDEQDSGSLVLTHIYLLVATFVPLWLQPCRNVLDVQFVHFAGLISIGVGDAFASIGGSVLGKRKLFHDSGKTFEGTMCFFAAEIVISQIISCFLAGHIVLLHPYVLFSCLILALLEAFTSQIDNLVLPLFSFLLFYYV